MKNILSRAAFYMVMSLSAISCGDVLAPADPTKSDTEVGSVTFTARLSDDSPLSKVAIDIDADGGAGKVSFTAGDWMLITDGTDNSERVTLTDDNINDDGSATFTVNLISTSGMYYALCADADYFSSIGSNRKWIYLRESAFNDITSGRTPHAAMASCTSSERNLQFKSVLALIRFRAGSDDIKKVVFTGNNDETVNGTLWCRFDENKAVLLVQAAAKLNGYKESVARTSGIGKDYYIALPSGLTLSKGFTVTAYDASENVLSTLSTKKEFKTVANKIYDIGVLLSAYERWQAGEDITIGGETFNKSTYGDGTLVKCGGTATGSGVFFIQNVATASSLYEGNAVFISNDPAGNATLNLSENSSLQFSSADMLAFSRMDINTPAERPLIQSAGSIGRLFFSDCRVNVKSSIFDCMSTGSLARMDMVDSDFIIDSSSEDVHLLKADDNTDPITNLTFKNNVFWCGTPHEFHLLRSDDGAGVRVKSLSLENNTFYNVDNGEYQDGLKPFLMMGLPGSLSVKANLIYSDYVPEYDSDGSPAATDRTAYLLGYRAESFSYSYIASELSGITSWYGMDGKVGGLGFYTTDVVSPKVSASEITFLDNSRMNSLDENPFTSIDLSANIYQKKEAYEGYGADR